MDIFSRGTSISGGYTVSHKESCIATNPYFLTFDKLIGHLLLTLAEAFPECRGTTSLKSIYDLVISNNQKIKIDLIQFWYDELGEYNSDLMDPNKGILFVCAKLKEKHGESKIKDLNFMTLLRNANALATLCHPSTLLELLQLEQKWHDPGLNHESKMYLLQYFVHLNASATLYHIVPDALASQFYTMTEQFRNERNGDSNNMIAFCEKFQPVLLTAVRSGLVSQDDLLCFAQNMNTFVTAIACMTFGVDQSQIDDATAAAATTTTNANATNDNNNECGQNQQESISNLLGDVQGAYKSISQNVNSADVAKFISNEQLPNVIKSYAEQLNIPSDIIQSEKTEKIIKAIQSLPPDTINTIMTSISTGNPAAVMNANFLALIVSNLEQNGVAIQDLVSAFNAENITHLVKCMKDSPMIKSNPSAQSMIAKLETIDPNTLETMMSFANLAQLGGGGEPERPSLFDGGDPDVVY